MSAALFAPGQIVITTHAKDALHPADVPVCLHRHLSGDWGELCEEDRAENQRALSEGLRLLSVYRDRYGRKFYIITEHDRSVTTILLPEDH